MDPNLDIYQVASIIDFPKSNYNPIKAIGMYVVKKIPILAKYISFVKQSKDTNPIFYLSKTIVIMHPAYSDENLSTGENKTKLKSEG